jgi:hypothetical protein
VSFLLLKRWGVGAVLLAGSLLLFHRALFDGRFAIPYDLPEFHFPLAWQIAEGLREGRIALWDPYTYCGFPLHANVQAQMFYPPAWPIFAAAAALGGESLRWLLEWQVALHVWLAGLFAYGLARRLGLGRAAALFAGLCFELSGYFVSQAQHLGAVCGAAWIPLAWRGAIELNRRPDARRTAMLAAGLAMSFLAGFTAITILAFASTAVLALLLWMRRPAHFRPPLFIAAAAALAVALCAVQLLPTLELSALSTAYKRGTFSEEGGGIPWQGLVSMLLPGRYGVLDSIEPKFGVNPSFLYLYAGLATLGLALAGIVWSAGWRWVLAVMTGFHLLWMMGGHTPAGLTAYRALPAGIRSAFYQEFASAPFLLAVCLLAGFGFEKLIARRASALTAAVLCLAVLDPVYRASTSWFVASPPENFPLVSRDVFEESRESPLAARRAAGRSLPPGRMETYRDSMRWMSHAPVLEIATPNGNDPLALERVLEVRRIYAPMEDWVRTSEARSIPSPVMDLLNVTALVAWEDDGAAPPAEHFRFLEAVHGHRFYANPAALPRFFLAGRVVASKSMAESVSLLRRHAQDAGPAAIVEGPAPRAQSAQFAPVRVLRYEPERIELEYDSPVDAVLVSSEAAYPGWKAALDGKEIPLLLVNGAFRGAAAPAGRHRVVMRYSPASLWWGGAISLLALAGLLAAGAVWDNRVEFLPVAS